MNRLCPVCEKAYHLSIRLPACKECGLLMDPTPSNGIYGDEYLLHYKLYGQNNFSALLLGARQHFIQDTIQIGDVKSLLDYGCGANIFAPFMDYTTHILAFGYDPFLNKDHSFLKHLKLHRKFDIVTFWDSFEHIRRLEIVPLLRGKYIFMTLPIIDDIKHDLMGWKHYVPGEHVWYFSTSALMKLFEKWNYKLIAQSDFEEKLRSSGLKSFCFEHVEDN